MFWLLAILTLSHEMAAEVSIMSVLEDPEVAAGASVVAPKLGDGSAVDWWFAFKLNSAAYPGCSGTRKCLFGGEVQDYKYGYGLQYLLASHAGGTTKEMELKTDCLGTGDDPVAKTFDQIYGGTAPNFVIWNDQFYNEPTITLTPACNSYEKDAKSCSAPWGHSKGAMAWDENGNGFILQVTTPDWPGSGDKTKSRKTQGNTLGCIADDNTEVSQHFFALKLTHSDTKAVLTAMQTASVVTDPSNSQLVKLTNGPSDLKTLAQGLAKLDKSTTPYQATLSTGAKLIAKPQALNVPVFQMVSSIVGKSLRTATWWTSPAVPSSKAGKPGCWSSELGTPGEVQVAMSGQWKGKKFNLTGGLGGDHNHAKLGYSLDGSLAIMGDMNQQGSYDPKDRSCSSSQNGRGGMFFVVDDATLHKGLMEMMTGETAPYYGGAPGPSPSGPSPPPSPTPPNPPSPTPPGPSPTPSSCGGSGVRSNSCGVAAKKAAGCVYVKAADKAKCGVTDYGCYLKSSLPKGCAEKTESLLLV